MNLWLEIKLMRSPCFPVARKRWTERLLLSRRVKVTSCTECFIPKSFQLDSTCITVFVSIRCTIHSLLQSSPWQVWRHSCLSSSRCCCWRDLNCKAILSSPCTGVRNRVSQTHQLQIHSKVTRGSCWNLLFWWILWWTSNHNSYSIPNCQHFQFWLPIQFLNDFAIKISLDIPFDTSHQQSLESKICWSALREDLHSTTTPWCLSAIMTFGHKNFPSFEFLGCISLWRFDQSFLTRVNIRQDRFINSYLNNRVRQQDISWILPSKRHGISWVDLGCDINLYDWITMDSLQKILQVFFRPSGFHLDLDWSPSRIHQNLYTAFWIDLNPRPENQS